jgi:biofilm protein TabA
MRKVARTRHHLDIKQVILHQNADGVYLFPCTSLDDGFANGDEWYKDFESAELVCRSEYGILSEDWQNIPDPLEHCQQDWIESVRVVGRDQGKPQWGRFEKRVNDAWKEIELVKGKWVFKTDG